MRLVSGLCIVILMIIFASCKQLEYQNDLTYLSPIAGNYPDYFVRINGEVCRDMSGNVGMCAIKHSKNSPLTFSFLAQEYNYSLDFRCGNAQGIFFRKRVDVIKGNDFSFEISAKELEMLNYANCVGDIFPIDRDDTVSSFFEVRIRFSQKDYMAPMDIYTYKYKKKNYLVLGQHAYRAKVKVKNKWYKLKEQTVFKFTNQPEFAMIETKNFRHQYYFGDGE